MIRRELTLRLPNSPGALGAVCRLLDAERVNILALSLESTGLARLVVDNPVHAAATLREQHHHVTERDVIVLRVPNAPGGAAAALQLVAAAGVNVDYAYGGGDEGSPSGAVVIGVDDALRAASLAGV
jgi:hypothetical protein